MKAYEYITELNQRQKTEQKKQEYLEKQVTQAKIDVLTELKK